MKPEVFEGTAQEAKMRLAKMPDDQMVRVIVGNPSLTVIARRLQAAAAANGMTDLVHDALIQDIDQNH